MEQTEEPRIRKKQAARVALRAFNGAVLGLPLGGLIGALLGWAFAAVVLRDPGGGGGMGAFYGVFPGAFAGIFIGMTAVVRDHRKGLQMGTLTGTAVGCLYAWLVFSSFMDGGITASILASGVIGGFTLSLLIRMIRARWKWWTRWEE